MKLLSLTKCIFCCERNDGKFFLAFLLYAGVFMSANGQSISIQSVSINEGKVTLGFNIEDSDPNRRYTLRLYSSQDNYVQPLTKVTGNIGVNQQVGGNKEIIWHAGDELAVGFSDYVSLEIRAFIYIPFIEMEDLSKLVDFKRGKSYTISWTGGRDDQVLNFDLYKDDKKTGKVFEDIANKPHSYELILPKNTKPGNDYHFVIADQSNNDNIVFSTSFTVKPQIPLIIKISAGVAVGVGIYIIGKGADWWGSTEPQEIPLPDDPNRGG